MANFPQDLKSLMAGTTTISSVVGTTPNARIHYNHIPQSSEMSHIWFRTASDVTERTLDGTGGLHEAFLDLEVVGSKEGDAQDLADAVFDKLDGFSGAVGTASAQGIFLSDKDDNYFPRSIGDDEGRHVVAYDLHVWYTT